MVLIPAGVFEMGSNDKDANDDEKPLHTVYLDAFYIDKYEVTVGQYKQFIQATGHRAPNWDSVSKFSPTDQHPITGVFWSDAKAYAKSADKQLPTEAEWEKAARGGLIGAKYPWGNAIPNGTQCNFADKHSRYSSADESADDGYKYTAPVGSFPANGYGLHDMAGNVDECCLDEYQADFYSSSPRRNPIAKANVVKRMINEVSPVVRGGNWNSGAENLPCSVRSTGALEPKMRLVGVRYGVGFRCVRSVKKR